MNYQNQIGILSLLPKETPLECQVTCSVVSICKNIAILNNKLSCRQ